MHRVHAQQFIFDHVFRIANVDADKSWRAVRGDNRWIALATLPCRAAFALISTVEFDGARAHQPDHFLESPGPA